MTVRPRLYVGRLREALDAHERAAALNPAEPSQMTERALLMARLRQPGAAEYAAEVRRELGRLRATTAEAEPFLRQLRDAETRPGRGPKP